MAEPAKRMEPGVKHGKAPAEPNAPGRVYDVVRTRRRPKRLWRAGWTRHGTAAQQELRPPKTPLSDTA